MPAFEINRADLRSTRVVEEPAPGGVVVLAVDRFGLTANNVTYAVFGEAMSYWGFFPAEDAGWGRMPVWGFADVAESDVPGVEVGARVYGYLPPASHLAVVPARVDAHGFVDAAPHRAELPAAYQGYTLTATDPFYDAGTEALQMLLRPLFLTSWLIDDQLDDDGLTAQGPIVISSASSKTALAAAHQVKQREGSVVIGLTSAGSRAFVEGLELYDQVVTYDDVSSLDHTPATYVDISGDGGVRRAVHEHFGDALLHSMVVGATHWEQAAAGGGSALPGPPPTFFFAPTRAAKRSGDWGAAGFTDRGATAWQGFCAWAASWLTPIEASGFEAVEAAYLAVLEGEVAPDQAHVLSV